MLAREADHLAGLGLGDVARVGPGHASPLGVDVEHDFVRGVGIVMEELHQNVHHENLGRVIVVVKHDLVEARLFHLDALKGSYLPVLLRIALGHELP